MYCGDETGAYIGDIGSNTCRFGYGGEDSPKWVVPSYVANYNKNDGANHSNNSNNLPTSTTSSNYYIPTSCYSSHLADHHLDPILRRAQCPNENESNVPIQQIAHQHPQVDPTAFLQQGDVVQNWDAFEEAWQMSFDVLRVRDKYKHTKGGGSSSITEPSHTTDGGDTRVSSTKLRSTTTTASVGADERCAHPLFCITPGATHICGTKYNAAVHRDQLVHYTEIFMEKLDASSMFCAPTPMLGSFSLGRQTALVVDIGAGGCRVTPIIDGLILKQAQRRNGRGGDYLGHVQWNALILAKQQQRQQQPAYILPRCMIRSTSSNNASSSVLSSLLYQWGIQDVMYEFRTSSHVSLATWQYDETPLFQDVFANSNTMATAAAAAKPGTPTSSTHPTSTTTVSSSPSSPMDVDDTVVDGNVIAASPSASDSIYSLPDGTMIDLTSPMGKDLCRIPELLFTDTCPFVSTNTTSSSSSILAEHDTLSNLPLHKLIHASLLAVPDVDIRKELCNNILLVGAGSLVPNLEQRLSVDVKRVVPSMYKCRVVASRFHAERSCAAWIGASVLTSLGSFQQLWLSRTEYEEYGVHLSIQRFP